MALNVEGVDNTILVNELQLGEQLNTCIHAKRRSDFSLMLAMLTDDVRAHSQFSLPLTEVEVVDTTDTSLRKTFHLPEPAPLALKSTDQLKENRQTLSLLSNTNSFKSTISQIYTDNQAPTAIIPNVRSPIGKRWCND